MQSTRLLLIALAVTVGLTVWIKMQPKPDDETDLAAPSRPRKAAVDTGRLAPLPPAAGSHPATGWLLQRAGAPAPEVDLFAASVVAPPELPPSAAPLPIKPQKLEPPPPPPPPTAPPLPLRYLGRMVDGQATKLFVSFNGDSIALKPGDVVGGSYRLDSINDKNAVFTYIPLNQTQNLVFGDSP